MIKLYLKTGRTLRYWEAWDASDGTITVHYGKLGQTGRSSSVQIPDGQNADALIERESRRPLAEGYEPIDIDDHTTIVVEYDTKDDWGDVNDLKKRHAIEGILNECLGWSGNGHCDGGSIGSGTMESFSYVVDPVIATKTIVEALEKKKLSDGARIAIVRDGEYEFVWPEDCAGGRDESTP